MYKFGLVSAKSDADIHKNIETIAHYAQQAHEAGCTALCFPECFLTGYSREQASSLAISMDSDPCEQISELAFQWNLDLLVEFMEQDENVLFINHSIFYANGTIRSYRKTHLGSREAQVFESGDSLRVYPLSCGIKIGFQLCVESHFPEITQTLALRGASVIFAPHAVPNAAGSRETIWTKYIPARSYDNRVYMACCNLWDEEHYGGGLLVTAPDGETMISSYKNEPEMISFEVDPKRDWKKHFFPSKRRPELYH